MKILKGLFVVCFISIILCSCGNDLVTQNSSNEENMPDDTSLAVNDNDFFKAMKKDMTYVRTEKRDGMVVERFYKPVIGSGTQSDILHSKDAKDVEYTSFDEHFYTIYDFCYKDDGENQNTTYVDVISHPVGCCLNYTPENYVPHICGAISSYHQNSFGEGSGHNKRTYYYTNDGNLAAQEEWNYSYSFNKLVWTFLPMGKSESRTFTYSPLYVDISNVDDLQSYKSNFVAYDDNNWAFFVKHNDKFATHSIDNEEDGTCESLLLPAFELNNGRLYGFYDCNKEGKFDLSEFYSSSLEIKNSERSTGNYKNFKDVLQNSFDSSQYRFLGILKENNDNFNILSRYNKDNKINQSNSYGSMRGSAIISFNKGTSETEINITSLPIYIGAYSSSSRYLDNLNIECCGSYNIVDKKIDYFYNPDYIRNFSVDGYGNNHTLIGWTDIKDSNEVVFGYGSQNTMITNFIDGDKLTEFASQRIASKIQNYQPIVLYAIYD